MKTVIHCIFFIFYFAAISAYSAVITRGPYLQLPNESEITIRWRSDSNSDSVVYYGDTPTSLTNTKSISGLRTEHEVRLTDLTENTQYFYAVGSSTETIAGGDSSYRFTTHPSSGHAIATRVWLIGDSGTANANAAAVYNAYLAHPGADNTNLWIMLGDNAYGNGTDSEYQRAVFDMYPELLRRTPLWSTLGNHDGYSADSASESGPYYDIFTLPRQAEAGGIASGTEAYYSFDYGDIHFICLDSYESDRSVGSTMLNWLENDINATDKKWIIAFWHHPPYTKGSHNSDLESDLIDMRENVLPIIESYGVDLVLNGHSHSYERSYLINGHYGHSSTFSQVNIIDGGDGNENGDGAYQKSAMSANSGVVYSVAGASGKISGGPLDHTAMQTSLNQLGSIVLDINDNRLDYYYLNSTGGISDQFTIMKGEDTQPPSIKNIEALSSNEVVVNFSEKVDPTTANNTGNYFINQGTTISSASIENNQATLTTSELSSGIIYTLTTNNIEDINKNIIPPNTQGSFIYQNIQSMSFQNNASPNLTYTGMQDTHIVSGINNSNFGSSETIRADGDNADEGEVVSLLSWDISNAPADATITSAQIQINIFNASIGTYTLYTGNTQWDQNFATWRTIDPHATKGIEIGRITTSAVGTYTITLKESGLSIVQDWLNGISNDGIYIMANNTTDGIEMHSSENNTVSMRPKLTISYITTTQTTDFSYTENDLTADFNAISSVGDNAITGWQWDFGDNKISNEKNPSHTYDSAGNYQVTLTINHSDGSSTQAIKTITVTSDIIALDTESPTIPEGLSATNETATSATIHWHASTDNIGVTGYRIQRDGSPIADVSTTYFDDTGLTNKTTYGYTIEAYDEENNTSEQSATLNVSTPNSPPTSLFTYNAHSLETTFTDKSTDSDGPPTSWLWDFGDNNTSTEQNPVHTYTLAGNYDVSLTVTDNNNDTGQSTQTLSVSEESTFNNVEFQEGSNNYSGVQDTYISSTQNNLNFNDSISLLADGHDNVNGEIVTLIAWDISSIPANATIIQAQIKLEVFNPSNGLYELYAANTDWQEDVATWTTITPHETHGDMIGSFSPSSTGASNINLNAKGIALVQAWVNAAPNNGVYIMPNGTDNGADFRSSEYETVIHRPQLIIAYTTHSTIHYHYSETDLTVSFSNTTLLNDESIVDWEWDLGDGTLSSHVNPNHTYATTGTYTATLSITRDDGALEQFTQTVIANNISDAESPSTPLALYLSDETPSSITINWEPSTDNIGIRGYFIERNNTRIGNTSTTSFEDTNLSPNITYTYNVIAYDAMNNESTASEPITFTQSNNSPASLFSYSHNFLDINFNDLSSNTDNLPTSWIWHFGDGTTSTAQHPQHTYQKAGTYIVQLSVTDAHGTARQSIQTITVNNTATPETLTLQQEVNGYTGAQDTYITEGAIYANYGSSTSIVADSNHGSYQKTAILMSWDVAELPADFVVSQALLELNVTTRNAGTYKLYANNTSWQQESATWATAMPNVSENDIIGRISPAADGRYRIRLNPHGISTIQRWIDTRTNNGIYIVPDDSSGEIAINSSEAPIAKLRPTLTLSSSTNDIFNATFNYSVSDLSVDLSGTRLLNNDEVSTWQWDFGDNNTSTELNPSHTYTVPGAYAATLTITNKDGSIEQSTHTVTTADIIDSNAPSSPSELIISKGSPSNITLIWSASSDNIGVAGYHIERDGIRVGNITTTSFNDSGLTSHTAYTYTIIAYDEAYNTSEPSEAVTFTTQSHASNALFGYSSSMLKLSFSDQSNFGNSIPTGWLWDFGDGKISTEQNPQHTYLIAGTYIVKLSITNEYGQTEQSTQSVTVSNTLIPETFELQQGLYGYSGAQDTYIAGDARYANYGSNTSILADGDHGSYGKLTTLLAWELNVLPDTFIAAQAFIELNITTSSRGKYNLYTSNTPWQQDSATWTVTAPNTTRGKLIGSFHPISRGIHRIALNADGLSSIQRWINTGINNGIYIVPEETSEEIAIRSSEDNTISSRPKLIVSSSIDKNANTEFFYAEHGSTIDFSNPALMTDASFSTWQWDFGDGHLSYEQNPKHIYITTGTYTVTLTITRHDGSTVQTVQTITAQGTSDTPSGQNTHTQLQETFEIQQGLDDYSGAQDTYVTDGAHYANYGSNMSIMANSNHGSYGKTSILMAWQLDHIPTDFSVTKAFIEIDVTSTSSGTYHLYANNTDWQQNTATRAVVNPDASHGALIGSLKPTTVGLYRIALNNDGLTLVQNWITDQSNHGIYIIPEDNSGEMAIRSSEDIIAQYRPKLIVSSSTAKISNSEFNAVENDLTISFSNSALENDTSIASWQWDFGDNNLSIERNPNHIYLAAGTYIVTLTITRHDGSMLRSIQTIMAQTPSEPVNTNVDQPLPDIFEFQQGLNYYTGAQDTAVAEGARYANYGSNMSIRADSNQGSYGEMNILMAWQVNNVPTEFTVAQAYIELDILTPSTETYNIYANNTPWQQESATWAVVTPATTRGDFIGRFTPSSRGIHRITLNTDGLSTIQNWINTGVNNGIYIIPEQNSSEITIRTSEDIMSAFRPKLAISSSTAQISIADFTSTTNGSAVDFSNSTLTNDASISSWQWDFGDDNLSNEQNPSHIYLTAGTYTVTLTITKHDGSTVQSVQTVTTQAASDSASTDSNPQTQEAFELQQGLYGYSGAQDTSISSGALYANYGSNTPIISDNNHGSYGEMAMLMAWELTELPNDFSVTKAFINLHVTTHSTGTYNLYASNTPWQQATATWKVVTPDESTRGPLIGSLKPSSNGLHQVILNGDGIAMIQRWIHTGINNGIYIIPEESSGEMAIRSSEDVITAFRPKLRVSSSTAQRDIAEFTTAKNGLTVAFANPSLASDDNITGWQWDFGDGDLTSEYNPTHSYTIAGVHTVTLTITLDDGTTIDSAQDINISTTPSASEQNGTGANNQTPGSNGSNGSNGSQQPNNGSGIPINTGDTHESTISIIVDNTQDTNKQLTTLIAWQVSGSTPTGFIVSQTYLEPNLTTPTIGTYSLYVSNSPLEKGSATWMMVPPDTPEGAIIASFTTSTEGVYYITVKTDGESITQIQVQSSSQ